MADQSRGQTMPERVKAASLTRFKSVKIGLSDIALSSSTNHSMSYALEGYVRKVPYKFLFAAALKGIPVKVLGMFEEEFKEYCEIEYPEEDKQKWIIDTDPERKWSLEKANKTADSQRAQLFTVFIDSLHPMYIILVPPGRAFTKHFGHMVRQYLDTIKPDFSTSTSKIPPLLNLSIEYLPLSKAYFRSRSKWIDFNNWVCQKWHSTPSQKIIIMGYTELFSGYCKIKATTHGSFIGAIYKNILYAGLTHTYWGDLVEHFVDCLCELSPTHLIFVGKGGLVTKTQRIDMFGYFKVPEKILVKQQEKLQPVQIENYLAFLGGSGFADINENSTHHCTVETVMEQTLEWREKLLASIGGSQHCVTVDNELGLIAEKVAEHKDINLGAIIIPSDYVRSMDDITLILGQDLDPTAVSKHAKDSKDRILHNIHKRLISHFITKEDTEHSPIPKYWEDEEIIRYYHRTHHDIYSLKQNGKNKLHEWAIEGRDDLLAKFLSQMNGAINGQEDLPSTRTPLECAASSVSENRDVCIVTLLLFGAEVKDSFVTAYPMIPWSNLVWRSFTCAFHKEYHPELAGEKNNILTTLACNLKVIGLDQATFTKAVDMLHKYELNHILDQGH